MSEPGDDLRHYATNLAQRLGIAAGLLCALKPMPPHILRWALRHRRRA
jgi:hypothetical protein